MPRKKKPYVSPSHERWLVSYADFITLLFAFFTTLYAISTVDKTKAGKLVYSMRTAFNTEIFTTPQEYMAYQGISMAFALTDGPPGIGSEGGRGKVSGGDDEEIEELSTEIQGIVKGLDVAEDVSVKLEGRGLVVSLSEGAFFPSGSAAIDALGKQLLDQFAERLRKVPFKVLIEGHTDNRPIRTAQFRSNWELSTARATTVIAYLVEGTHFDPKRLSAAGYAEHFPIADNATAEGRAKNRRVDLVIQYRKGEGERKSMNQPLPAFEPPPAGAPAPTSPPSEPPTTMPAPSGN